MDVATVPQWDAAAAKGPQCLPLTEKLEGLLGGVNVAAARTFVGSRLAAGHVLDSMAQS